MLGVHSFGIELRSCDVNGISVSETLMPAGLALEEHAHERGQICFVLDGEYEERIGGHVRALSPGRIQFHAPGERHANSFGDESDVLTLLVSIEEQRWIDMSCVRPLTRSAALAAIEQEIRRELATGDDVSRAAIEGLALLLLSRVARAGLALPVVEPAWVADAIALIDHRYDSRLSLADVADAVGVHRATLAAAFRRFRSISVGEYIRAVRIDRAMTLLQTGMPLDEIACAAGFADQAHFGRVFKKQTGVTPGQVRTRNRRSP
jgi:AraC family transcriptional regulator